MLAEAQTRLFHIARDEELELVHLDTLQIRPNTFTAHRLPAAALDMDVELQKGLGDALFAAYWGRGEDVKDHGVLVAAAAEAGMEPEHARRLFNSDAFAAAVRTEEERAADLGIHAAPTFRFDDRAMVSGAQPPAPPTRAALEAIDGG